MKVALLTPQAHTAPKRFPRPPLPPFDMRGPYTVHTTLPSNLVIPPVPDRHFMRANCWSVEVPGLPFIPAGTSSVHPDRALSWFLPEYMDAKPSSYDDFVLEQSSRRYTHIIQSRGGGFGRKNPASDAELCTRLKNDGFYVGYFLTSKDIDPHAATAQTYINIVRPYCDALLTANAVDVVCLGWELNLFWDPVELQTFKEWVFDYFHPHGIEVAGHFSPYVTAWQLPGHPRADFYADGTVQQHWYQTDSTVSLSLMQAHFYDAMKLASGLEANNVRLVAFEVSASSQFDGRPVGNEHPNEDDGDMYGYGLLCTPGPWVANGGYGNGARYPDGSWL